MIFEVIWRVFWYSEIAGGKTASRWGLTIHSVWSSSSIHFVRGWENSLRWGPEQIVCSGGECSRGNLQGLLTQISRPSRPAFGTCIRDFDPPHPPFNFYLQICMSGRNPRKTRSASLRRHGQSAPVAHSRCRPAPGTPGGEPARWGGRPRRPSP